MTPTATLNDQASVDVLRRIHDWAAESVNDTSLSKFLQDLATTLCYVFNARMVAVWDNNHRNDCLVLQSSAPEREDIIVSHAIATETSSTGAAVEKGDIVFFPDILNPGGKRHFTHPKIVKKLGLKSMLSVPVFSPSQNDRVGVVINLCFDQEANLVSSATTADIKRVASVLGSYIQYLVYRRDEQIAANIRIAAAASKGILPLFDRIKELFRTLTHSAEVGIFRWDNEKQDLYCEAPADVMLDAEGKATRWLSESTDFAQQFDSTLIATCVAEGKTLVVRTDVPAEGDDDWQPINVQCPFMAAPIHASTGEVLGVVRCKKPLIADKKSPSFSSFDVIALECLARALAPSVERFLRIREGTELMKIVEDVSRVLSEAYELDTSLQNMIETLVMAMHSKFGSIYLRREGTDSFVIRAATGPRKRLLDYEAEYKIGEGITGEIATGKLLNFRTREELRSYPGRRGKYHEQVWGKKSSDDSDTLLGVPIIAGDKVIGIWKIENVCQNDDHPDPYYTDEDVQAAQVISYFLKYVIQNYKQEQARLRQLIQLPVTSDRIQRARDEGAAISVMMNALEDAGFAGAVLSLYDPKTSLIAEREFFGFTWSKQDAHPCHINDFDIRALTLKTGQAELVEYSMTDVRCTNAPTARRMQGQYVLPLRVEDELIGTLQVDVGGHGPDDPELLPLRAFASHLAVAISRTRSIQEALALTEQIMQSSRFITAEALSATAIHSLKHNLGRINAQITNDLKRDEIRKSAFLRKTLEEWETNLQRLEVDIKNALLFVRAPIDENQPFLVDLHEEIGAAISTWTNYINTNGCKVSTFLNAKESKCMLQPGALSEIMAVLLVNAVQAHARHVTIRTYNDLNIRTASTKTIREGFCVDCEDDGDGLPTMDYEKIFEPTYTTRPKNLGTGLGLFVARRLARRGRGDLEVVDGSQNSRSTAFRLSLPLAIDREQPRELAL